MPQLAPPTLDSLPIRQECLIQSSTILFLPPAPPSPTRIAHTLLFSPQQSSQRPINKIPQQPPSTLFIIPTKPLDNVFRADVTHSLIPLLILAPTPLRLLKSRLSLAMLLLLLY